MTLTAAQLKATADGTCCRWCRAPLYLDASKWVNSGGWERCTSRKHEPGPYIEAEAAGAPLREALERAVELVLQSGARGRHWEDWLPKARVALAATPAPAPLDVEALKHHLRIFMDLDGGVHLDDPDDTDWQAFADAINRALTERSAT